MDLIRENDDPDAVLMKSIAEGDGVAFRHLVERHQNLVVGTAARMVGTAEAEDLAQKVFLNVWKAAPRWRPHARVTTWILTITRRLVFNESRRRGRARIVPQATLPENEETDFPDPAFGPREALIRSELHSAIANALLTLPEKERLALVLREYEGLPYEEIAEVLGTSLSAVKSLLFRGRSSLRIRLAPFLERGG
jgi:RNA polymerase sigma-70 factor (ECF subfamily)